VLNLANKDKSKRADQSTKAGDKSVKAWDAIVPVRPTKDQDKNTGNVIGLLVKMDPLNLAKKDKSKNADQSMKAGDKGMVDGADAVEAVAVNFSSFRNKDSDIWRLELRKTSKQQKFSSKNNSLFSNTTPLFTTSLVVKLSSEILKTLWYS